MNQEQIRQRVQKGPCQWTSESKIVVWFNN
jgi:hypothetical protein